jgi:hypothetical protein
MQAIVEDPASEINSSAGGCLMRCGKGAQDRVMVLPENLLMQLQRCTILRAASMKA